MNDLETPTPNARRLRQALGRPVPAEETEEVAPKEFSLDTTNTPFLELEDVTVNIKCDDPMLGIETEECPARRRGYIYDVKKGSSFSKVRGWKKKYRGAWRRAQLLPTQGAAKAAAHGGMRAAQRIPTCKM